MTATDHLARARASWDHMGSENATFAIMTEPGKEAGWDLQAFWQTGEQDVDHHLIALHGILAAAGQPALVPQGCDAVDFGCGLGRLSRALRRQWQFRRVLGLDFAPSMIDQARDLNADTDDLRFEENPGPGLGLDDGSADFLITLITLQHIETELQHAYLRDFLRVLRPGGTAVLGLMAAPLRWPKAHEAPQYQPGGSWQMEMHGVDVEAAVRTLRAAGGRVLDFRMDLHQSEWSDIWVGVTYYVRKLEA